MDSANEGGSSNYTMPHTILELLKGASDFELLNTAEDDVPVRKDDTTILQVNSKREWKLKLISACAQGTGVTGEGKSTVPAWPAP